MQQTQLEQIELEFDQRKEAIDESETPKSARRLKKPLKKAQRDLSDADLNMSDIQGENSHINIKDLSVVSQVSPLGNDVS